MTSSENKSGESIHREQISLHPRDIEASVQTFQAYFLKNYEREDNVKDEIIKVNSSKIQELEIGNRKRKQGTYAIRLV